MCDYCNNINLVENFYTPLQYEQTTEYIQELINNKGYILVDGNCEIGKHKKDGKWVDDIIYHTIKCPNCGQIFSCVANTYRGSGGFQKGQ